MVVSAFWAGKIHQMVADGNSIRAVSRTTGFHRDTVSKVLRHLDSYTAARRERVRKSVAQRRQALRTLALKNKVITTEAGLEYVLQRMYPTARHLSVQMAKRFKGYTMSHVWRDLKVLGLKLLVRPKVVCNSPENNVQRLRFAVANLKTRTARFVFSDECWINDNDNTHRKELCDPSDPHSRPSTRRFQKRPTIKLMIWGAIGLNFKSSLIFLDRSVTSETYIADILEKAKDELKTVTRLIFMQDNARPHVAGKSMAWFDANDIDVLKNWPPHSPHLNPIEHLWALIHQEIAVRQPKSEAQLRKVAQEVWDGITIDQINCYVLGFKNGLKKTIQLNGEPW